MKLGLPRACLKRMVTLKKEVNAMELMMGTRQEELTPWCYHQLYISNA
ncbi:hypothetical protein BTN49_1378 [Candidatus Enterovibrio escicola]|uniref:Uncharacterized protein n=1 Tax=Candidatus Enterovibrio escicola TaxID=1927127 RepID=A0A2A5T3U0_9GAMM|nr:hypothetical protein BTN49_1378 [Candidatus Enterovibrio escacola]